MSAKPPTMACAIYTCKSSDEGLEQNFNSLDAQREASEAYVLSQQHEGWRALETRYDDGGYSGGTVERPALQRLLDDIDKKRIRVVIVYKVDRLTRSLSDFAKIVERFDAQGVSFVSVTQQFNTTSSMGRLTLNVLLSFTQFEREVTGERIRDKIAASKQKGMWMGGVAPIGYRGYERTLEVDETCAALIRHIYTRYQALGCVRRLKLELDGDGIVTPSRVFGSGRNFGGQAFSRGQLYRILSHPVYLGQIAHHDKVYPGQHPAIVAQELWESVQAQMTENRQGHQQRRSVPSSSLLAGLLVDAQGQRLIPSHSQKRAKRYRYYVSAPLVTSSRADALDGIRLPAQELEMMVIDALRNWLTDSNAVLDALAHPEPAEIQGLLANAHRLTRELAEGTEDRYRLIHRLIRQVMVGPESVQIAILPSALLSHDMTHEEDAALPCVTLKIPVRVQRCGLAMRLIIQGPQQDRRQEPDARLIQLIAKAHDWLGQLTSGKTGSVAEIAAAEVVSTSYVTRVIYRAFLAPDIVRAILDGTQPPGLTLQTLKQHLPLPIDWQEQRKLLGFTQR